MGQSDRDRYGGAEISKVRRAWKLGRAGTGTAAAAMGSAAGLTLFALRLPGQSAIHWLVPSAIAAVLVAGVVAAKRGHLGDAAVLFTPLMTATLLVQWFVASLVPRATLDSTTLYGGTYDAALALATQHLALAVPCLASALLVLAITAVVGLGRVVVPSKAEADADTAEAERAARTRADFAAALGVNQ